MSSQWEDAHPDPPCAHGLTGGRGAAERCLECGASVAAASPDERLREAEQAENEWSAYAVTLNQRLEALETLARLRGVDDAAIAKALAGVSAEAAPDGTTPTFCSRPDCGLRATGIAPDPDGFRWRPYCSDCMPAAEVRAAEAAPDDGWTPGCDDPEPRELGNIDTGEGWYET